MNFAFFGTSHFAVGVLDALKEAGFTPSLIITSPDTPAGRGKKLTPPPVKTWAEEQNIDCMQPERLDDATIAELKNTEWDVFVVAAYGKMLPKELIDIPASGTLNVHPSLLPKLRGPSPIQSAILTDAREAVGITIMVVDEEMDHGPIVAQGRVELEEWPPRADILSEVLAAEGGAMLAEVLPSWCNKEITPEAQDHTKATFTEKVTKEDACIDYADDAYLNLRKVRAFTPSPAAYTFEQCGNEEVRIKIIDAYIDEDGIFQPSVVIPAGKGEMSYEDFRRGCDPR